MWGYAVVSVDDGAGEVPGDNVVTVPGPSSTVGRRGQGLVVNLINELPVPYRFLFRAAACRGFSGGDFAPCGRAHEWPDHLLVHETGPAATGIYYCRKSRRDLPVPSGTHPASRCRWGCTEP